MAEAPIVEKWLRSLGQQQYTRAFVDNGYDDLEICKQIGYSDLDAIGVRTSEHRIVIYNAVELLRHRADVTKPFYYILENPNSPSKSHNTEKSKANSQTFAQSEGNPKAHDIQGFSSSTTTSNSSASGSSSISYFSENSVTQDLHQQQRRRRSSGCGSRFSPEQVESGGGLGTKVTVRMSNDNLKCESYSRDTGSKTPVSDSCKDPSVSSCSQASSKLSSLTSQQV